MEMELIDGFKAYLDGRFEQLLDNLATKDDIEDLKKGSNIINPENERAKREIVRLIDHQ